jgi:TM2 domain-containing membrane protein YozV
MESQRNYALAVALALILGHFGIHKFYIGKPWVGLLYLLFSWTFIPTLLGIIEGIMWIMMGPQAWDEQYGKR